MELNTVVISVDRYTELYEMEKNVRQGKRVGIYFYSRGGSSVDYYTDNEIIEDLKIEIEKLETQVERLNRQVEVQKDNKPEYSIWTYIKHKLGWL